jgi:membrane-bound lytic murein transglycosylase D
VLTLDLTREPNDIWDRIRRGFGMQDVPGPRTERFQSSYLKQPAYLDRMFNRGARYLYYIVGELERRGMPTEIALLPMVESSFNPNAHSHARASGLWQFIPSTGRSYKLAQNRWVDERRDVIASTNAALDYLADIYERHGDWHLALASYNRGENGVGRAIMRNQAAGRSTDYVALELPRETRDYLPKLQALKNIVAEPERYDIELPYVTNKQLLATLPAPVGIDLATAARYADMPLDEFLAFNPGFNLPAITSEGQTLVVPADRAETFAAQMETFKRSGKHWRSHFLGRNETLNSVAERYGLTVQDLQRINGLPAQSRPPAGYALLVPGPGVNLADALAVSELLPASARAAARIGVRIGPDRKAHRGKTQAGRGKAKAGKGRLAKTKGAGAPRRAAPMKKQSRR